MKRKKNTTNKNTTINVKIIMGVILPIVAVFFVCIVALNFMLNGQIQGLFKDNVIPLFQDQTGVLETEVKSVLAVQLEKNSNRLMESYTKQMESQALVIAQTALPLAEAFNFDDIIILIEQKVSQNENIAMIRLHPEKGAKEIIEKGSMSENPVSVVREAKSLSLIHI